MSTYTDLKNRVKETITVGFHPEDRITVQKARFLNEENEYWGSFSGSLSGRINIYSGVLSSVEIYNATLIDPLVRTSSGMIIDLGLMADQLEELSGFCYEDISAAISANREDIIAISNAISAVPIDTEQQLSGLHADVGFLSGAVDQEISDRIFADDNLSVVFNSRLTALAQAVAEEDRKIHVELGVLSDMVSAETSARIDADDFLSVSLQKYTDRVRHYELFSMNPSPQMPIKAKEFAVNKLVDYDMPDGFVVNTDRNQIVGWIEKYDEATMSCRFTAYSDAYYTVPGDDGSVLTFPYSQILGTGSYEFGPGENEKICQDGTHKLIYRKQSDFDDNYFDIELLKPNMRNVLYDSTGSIIGHVYGAGDGVVSSGFLQMTTQAVINNSILSVYSDSTPVWFTKDNPITAYDNGNSIITLESIQSRFHFETGISSWPQKLVFNESESGRQFCARIYRQYYDKPADGAVQSFAVSMRPAHDLTSDQRDYFLYAGDFENVIREYDDNSFDLLKYDTDERVLSYTRQKKLYGCQVVINENDEEIRLGLSSTVFNKDIRETDSAKISFAALEPYVQTQTVPLVKDRVYELTRCGQVLSCEVLDALGESRVEIIIGNSGSVDITLSVMNGPVAKFGDGDDYVDFGTEAVYDDQTDTLGRTEIDIETVDFGQDDPDRRIAHEGYFYISDVGQTGEEFTHLEFQRDYVKPGGYNSYNASDIVIEIPDKAEGSIESREFLFVIRPLGAAGRKANIKFVTPRGDNIQFFAEHLPEFRIDCGKFITFRLQEITYGKFALLDWDQSMQESRLDDLDRRLEKEVRDRIKAVDDLSIALSGEIDDLSIALSGEIDDLSAEVFKELSSHELSIETNRKDINFLLYAERKSMVYLGTLLSVDVHEDKHLSCYFENALGFHTEPQFKFKAGFTYKLSSDEVGLSDSSGATVDLMTGDVITFNRDTLLSSVMVSDFDVICDYRGEIASLCATLSSEIEVLSAKLSGEINDLSAKLSGEIDDLSGSLSGTVDAKFALQRDLSELSGNFVELSGFIDRTIDDPGGDSPGIVKLRDEHSYDGESGFRTYAMHMISGTIKLQRL